ncbi:FkbM family methyltransferase [Candidatus Pelagibacter sp.]|nr:FkbM family methyltransferase [Candidatus Pelagibacter sp.]
MKDPFEKLVEIIRETKVNCIFNLLEIGAAKTGKTKEPFYKILDYFPHSKIIGFEIDKRVCDKMNSEASEGIKYYPYALGKANEKKKLYNTQAPMCTSLYKPNEKLISLYNNLDFAYLKNETEIETITLDNFISKNSIDNLDFIKIDTQGSELDIFNGGKNSLKNVVKIICEVEFVPIYEDQPLFGDVNKFLNENGFMFNKFLGLSGRALKPLILNKDLNKASQHMWSDAVFIKNIEVIQNLSDDKLLKLSILSAAYFSMDLSFFCLSIYDRRYSSNLAKNWISK